MSALPENLRSVSLPRWLPRTDAATLVDVVNERAESHPGRRAYVYLDNGETEGAALTYGDVDREARIVGAWLQAEGLAGERALLLYPPGLDFVTAFLGCLYGGVAPIPVYPPHPTRPERALPRLSGIVKDAAPRAALSLSAMLPMGLALAAHDPQFGKMRFVATDDLPAALAERWRRPDISAESMAFLQYTSGSTGSPKGVVVSHGNLMHNERLIQVAFEHGEASSVTSWLPLYHDMGLIGNLLQPLYMGSWCVLMSPAAFLQRPLRWLQAIATYRTETNGAPNFAYDLCVAKTTEEQRAALDLRCWTLAYTGAEPVRAATIDRFVQAFGPSGFRREAFYPCYGLAEGTLMVSGGRKADPPVSRRLRASALEAGEVALWSQGDDPLDARTLVGCGATLLDQRLAIADPETLATCPPHRIGEIWVSGPSVTGGYWNQPELSEQTFRARLADTGEGSFLRTGDLGFLWDGELFVTGRLKDLIIIDGRNHYPQDIELTAEQCDPAIRPAGCAAFSIDVAGVERLVLVAEVDRRLELDPEVGDADAAAVTKAIRRAISEAHDVATRVVLLVEAGAIPKTSSGKTRRQQCRLDFLSGALAGRRG
jgi:acyl-CoA synthetase (AMP-forming)/AMP-acid ligase II